MKEPSVTIEGLSHDENMVLSCLEEHPKDGHLTDGEIRDWLRENGVKMRRTTLMSLLNDLVAKKYIDWYVCRAGPQLGMLKIKSLVVWHPDEP